ncbi:origin recognition complex subunit 4 C-terminus-domain-containing protein [Apiosordaria backusii]|uniref:Origin recognition complex subunit 4 n=1 Tax=Apiosordaria backusii TaxID=314023 RepID=A0AA40BK64_9PEZI|nr:origin recognition complex subunit 4 C-terminus-domain-containing protein [Apiosordaria backusii]
MTTRKTTAAAAPAAGKKRARAQNEDEPDLSSTTAAKKARVSKKIPATATNATKSRGHRVASAPASAVNKPVEIPESDEEPQPQPKPLTATKKPRQPSGKQKTNIYDFPASDEDELSSAEVTTTTTTVTTTKRKTSKSVTSAPRGGKENVDGPLAEKKRRGRPPNKQPKKAAALQNGNGNVESGADSDATSTTAVSLVVPKTRKPKAVTSLRGGEAPAQVPKGILTPRKGQGLDGKRGKKNVVFAKGGDEDEAGDEEGETTPTKSRGKHGLGPDGAAAPEAEDEEEEGDSEEEEDDEVCTVCSKPDSKKGNQILFCDSCDMAVHQKCCGVARIPRGDWFCKDCTEKRMAGLLSVAETAKDRGASFQGKKATVVAQVAEELPDIPNFEQHLRMTQRVLLDRCAGRRRIKLRGQNEAYEKTYQLVEQTIVAGEGNSMLVIGARGCGKTTLVESVISDVSKQHKEEFHVVRLNGFIHTDDKLALREIWRQLGKEMAVEDDLVNKTSNYADTMASLLALLSHPSEIAESHEGVTSKSIVFLIDEFDLFATHARQTLLYNLFDIAQARKAPIAVVGLTTRIDVVESLEKRVKSRFSHRYVYLSLPKSLPAFWDVCRQGLSVDEEDMEAEGIDETLEGHSAFWKWWNDRIEALYNKDQRFKDHLESYFASTKSVSALLTTCVLPLAGLSPTSPFLRIPAPSTSVSLDPPDSKLHMLESLSDLDLSLLIAAARLDIVAHTDTVNFAMAYDEYSSLMSKQRVQTASSGLLVLGGGTRVWGRNIAGMAWERLVALGLLVPAASGGRGTAGLSGLDSKMWKLDVALEEIPAAVKLNAVLARWCKEI